MKRKKAKKNDLGKPQIELVPYDAEEEMAKVLTLGLSEYGKINWQNLGSYSRFISAAGRHLGQIRKGIDRDAKSGQLHAAHVMANMAFLIWLMKNRPQYEDRWEVEIKKGKRK